MTAQLLVCVINKASKVEEILEAFLDLGVTGATVLDSCGMGAVLTEDPIFAGFRQLLSGPGTRNKTILSVIEDEETLDAAISAVETICGRMENASTGILFTVPIDRVLGLKPGLG
jgi:nitrogen regulatory protein P-II 1